MSGAASSSKKRSENRQKGRVLSVRVSELEHQAVAALAERAGLTTGSYVRSRVLEKPTTRAVRRPVAEVQKVSGLLGQLSKIGTNLNQIAKRTNSGDTPLLSELHDTLRACRQIAEHAKNILDGNT